MGKVERSGFGSDCDIRRISNRRLLIPAPIIVGSVNALYQTIIYCPVSVYTIIIFHALYLYMAYFAYTWLSAFCTARLPHSTTSTFLHRHSTMYYTAAPLIPQLRWGAFPVQQDQASVSDLYSLIHRHLGCYFSPHHHSAQSASATPPAMDIPDHTFSTLKISSNMLTSIGKSWIKEIKEVPYLSLWILLMEQLRLSAHASTITTRPMICSLNPWQASGIMLRI